MKKTLGITALAICLVLTACAAGPTDNSEILNKIDSLQSSVDTLQTTLEEMQEPSSGSSTTEQASSSSTTEPSQPEEASGTPADYPVSYTHLDVYKRQAATHALGYGAVPADCQSDPVDIPDRAGTRADPSGTARATLFSTGLPTGGRSR